ncbi:hypothetical protein ABN584_12385 [Gloeocapsa sp. BRSZ]
MFSSGYGWINRWIFSTTTGKTRNLCIVVGMTEKGNRIVRSRIA